MCDKTKSYLSLYAVETVSLAYNLLRVVKLEQMKHENKRRGRETGEEDNKEFILKADKRQNVYHEYDYDCDYDYDRREESETYTCSSDNCLGLGVFDFPWLHDERMISKSSEKLNFQDTLSSSLHDTCNEPDVELCKQFFYEIRSSASIIKIKFPENKFENDEDESVDCIWSSCLISLFNIFACRL